MGEAWKEEGAVLGVCDECCRQIKFPETEYGGFGPQGKWLLCEECFKSLFPDLYRTFEKQARARK